MIFDKIILHNFGLYADRQTISLTPPSPDKPVILFGGLNGGGKTTLLDALQLCLFGPHAKISNRGTLAYPEYLARCIHRGAHPAEASITLTFRHTVEGEEDEYTLIRTWRKANGGCKEAFEVLKNGRPEPVLAENWATQVEDFMPANMAHLFLFDGEQIERYASKEDSSVLIGAAIQNLLGLDLVDQLERDLLAFERRKRLEEKDVSSVEQIAAAQKELDGVQFRALALGQERAALMTHQIERKGRELKEVEERFRQLGGQLFEERAAIENRLDAAKRAVKDGSSALRELAAGGMPLRLVKDLLESVAARDQREQASHHASEVLETLKARDEQVLEFVRTHSADSGAVEALQKFFESDRRQRESGSGEEVFLSLSPETRSELHVLLNGGLNELLELGSHSLEAQNRAVREEEAARQEHQSVPGSDILAEVIARRDKLKEEILDARGQCKRMDDEGERLKKEIERKKEVLTKLQDAETAVEAEREDRARTLRFSEKARGTLGKFRRAVIQRHVQRIEHMVLESYQQLLRKSALVSKLTIDPDTFALTLYGRDAQVLSAERLSAGERQLLAIALLWGLAKASGRPLPTAIDTPLGRLDSVHRTHLVERYLPFASHQVLLFSTDEEISGEYLELLRPWIGLTYQLNYDDAVG